MGQVSLVGDVPDLYVSTRTRVQPDRLARCRVQVADLAAHFPVIQDIDDQAIAGLDHCEYGSRGAGAR